YDSGWRGDACRTNTRHNRVKGGAEASRRVCDRRPASGNLKTGGGAWEWARESRLVIPVENPSDEALTVRLRVEDQKRRSMTGKVAIAPRSSRNLAISISAPPPLSMGMIAGPSLAPAGLDPGTLPVTATDGSIDAAAVALVRLGLLRP